jgi:hypothetical protein
MKHTKILKTTGTFVLMIMLSFQLAMVFSVFKRNQPVKDLSEEFVSQTQTLFLTPT